MLIKYLKNAPMANAGDIKDVLEQHARILILLGYAEETKRKSREKPAETDLLSPVATDN